MPHIVEQVFAHVATPDTRPYSVPEGVGRWRDIKARINEFSREELAQFLGNCLESLTKEDAIWNQDRRMLF